MSWFNKLLPLKNSIILDNPRNLMKIGQKFMTTLPETVEKPKLDKLYKKIEIEVRGNDKEVLTSYGIFSTTTARHLGIKLGRDFPAKRYEVERWTVLRSAFGHKKHRVQYEIRTYYRYLDFFKLTQSTADTFLEYLQRNLPEGVAMKVTKIEIQRLPEAVSTPPTS